MKLLFPVIMLLMLCPMAMAEVVHDFSRTCKQFFLNGKPPTVPKQGNRFKQICQSLSDVYYYATLYDTENRIPVYSAYEYNPMNTPPWDACRRDVWNIEPQLDDLNSRAANMAKETFTSQGINQALDKDYHLSGFNRGHLVPVAHQMTQLEADATFTLTNAAPQDPSFNSGQWRVTETEVAKLLTTNCISKNIKAYIVTGVIPGDTKINNRVTVPKAFWTAYCCIDQNGSIVTAGVTYGLNTNDPITTSTIQYLELQLGVTYQPGFTLFGGKCAVV